MSLSVWKRVGNNEWQQSVARGKTFDTIRHESCSPRHKGQCLAADRNSLGRFTRERSLVRNPPRPFPTGAGAGFSPTRRPRSFDQPPRAPTVARIGSA